MARCSRRRSRAGRQADLFVLVLEDEAVRVEVDSPIDVAVGEVLLKAKAAEAKAKAAEKAAEVMGRMKSFGRRRER